MEDIFEDEVTTTLSIFEAIGKFLKSGSYSYRSSRRHEELTPRHVKNMDQMAFIQNKTSSIKKKKKKKKTHLKTPSI